MAVQWTKRQEQAITARGCNLLVAAAAGSGKTAVLVERICALVREGQSIENMLVVTFTRAAAAEMREKILLAFQKEADREADKETDKPGNKEAGADDHAAHFAEQAALVEHAAISTLHGFCGALLRTYFPAAGVDPTFRVGDDREIAPLREEALREVVAQAYEEGDADFLALAECWTDEQIRRQVDELYRFLRSQPEPWAWMDRAIEAYRADAAQLERSPWVASLLSAAKARLNSAEVNCAQALRLCTQPGGCEAYIDALQSDLQLFERLKAAADRGYAALQTALAESAFAKLGAAKKGMAFDVAMKDKAQALRNAAKKIVQEELAKRLFSTSLEEQAKDLRALHPQIAALGTLARALESAFDTRKQARNLLDYEDLEHKALEAVRHDWVADALRAQYSALFVDEYQDSSVIQEELVQRIARADNVFLVGDVKQSIYRFRQAEPRLFLEKAESFSSIENEAFPARSEAFLAKINASPADPQATPESPRNRRIDLNQNFRSRPNVLAAINHIFAYAMRREETEIPYDAEAHLFPGLTDQPDADPAVELHLLDPDDENGASGDPDADGEEDGAEAGDAEEPAAREDTDADRQLGPGWRLAQEAALAAERIRALVGTPLWDAKRKEHRRLRYRDIVILLRVAKSVAQQVQRALEEQGIPVYSDAGDAYFAMPEVRMVIDLLRVVDNPLHDTALLGALHGPAARLSNDALAAIRQACPNPEASFYEAAQEYTQREGLLAERLRRFFALLSSLRLFAKAQPLEALIWRVYEETGCYARAGALPGGRARQANLRMLAERAASFQQRREAGLSAFLWEAEQLRARGDSNTAKALGEGEDVVRIMTMHMSKGLEFPVVICLELGRSFARKAGAPPPLACHAQLGLALRRIDPALRIRYDTLACDAQRVQRERESLADVTRLLYVAMTRAQDRLILIGHGNRGQQTLSAKLSRWAVAPAGALLTEAQSMVDLLVPPLLAHADGDALREGLENMILPESTGEASQSPAPSPSSRWDIRRYAAIDYAKPAQARAETWLDELARLPLPDGDSAIARGLGWAPPELPENAPRWKTTVSALLRKEQGEEAYVPPSPWPLFLGERIRPDLGLRGLDGAARGTAFHSAMRALELAALRGLEGFALQAEITAQLDALVSGERLRLAERESLRPESFTAFFASEIGQQMLAAETVRREWAFNLRIEVSGGMQLVQGVLDCCFLTNGGDLNGSDSNGSDSAGKNSPAWVLLDYKTDSDPDTEALRARYQPQLALYAQALTRITGIPVCTAALYLVKKGLLLPYDPVGNGGPDGEYTTGRTGFAQ